MSKDQTIGVIVTAACVILAIAFVGLLFFYDPYVASVFDLGKAADVRFWLIAIPVAVAFVAILAIGAWIGWTMAITPPPKPFEEISSETEDKESRA